MMKKVLFGFAFLLNAVFYFSEIKAQVNLPYTLTFTGNASGWSTTGIAHDGEGGTANINGLDIQIYTTLANFSFAAGSTIVWHDNKTYFNSANDDYNGITSGPDEEVTTNGVKGMVMKSADPGVNFSLQSILLYDWGYTDPFTIATYDNNTLVGSIDVTPDPDYHIITATQLNLLTPAVFNNIDEVRFYPKAPNPVFNLSFNNISLAAPSVLPVKLISFTGNEENNASVLLEWTTAMEQNTERFEIETSADGAQFSKVSSVDAKGNSFTESNYQFIYTGKTGASTFFRLKQIDRDGHAEYSPVILVKTNANNLFITVSPNPVRNRTIIASDNSIITGVHIFSASGTLVKSIRNNKSNKLSLDMSHLSKGTYYLQIESAGATTKKMIIKE
jgi:hypothetical protein